jgi:hypothetical protein
MAAMRNVFIKRPTPKAALIATVCVAALGSALAGTAALAGDGIPANDQKQQMLSQQFAPAPPKSEPANYSRQPAPPITPAQQGVSTPQALGGAPVPISAARAKVTNLWMGQVGQNYLSVYAGSVTSDPRQGALWVATINPQTGESTQQEFDMPQKLGALSIASVKGSTLVLTYPGGQASFDLQDKHF